MATSIADRVNASRGRLTREMIPARRLTSFQLRLWLNFWPPTGRSFPEWAERVAEAERRRVK
jgi:hypothetical protein